MYVTVNFDIIVVKFEESYCIYACRAQNMYKICITDNSVDKQQLFRVAE